MCPPGTLVPAEPCGPVAAGACIDGLLKPHGWLSPLLSAQLVFSLGTGLEV